MKTAWDSVAQRGMANHVMRKCLFTTSQALNIWNRDVFGFAQSRLKELEENLKIVLNHQGNTEVEIKVIQDQPKVQRNTLEYIFRQKSREVWLKHGDRNTKFFHLSLITQRRRNKIMAIKKEESWI